MAFGENVGRAFVELHASGDDVPDEISAAMDSMTPEFKKAGKEHAKAYDEAFQDEHGKSTDDFLKGFADKLHKTLPEWKKIETQADRNASAIRRLTSNVDENDEKSSRWLTRLHNHLERVNGSLDRAATRTGRMFGKGSRNDFVNLIGASVEALNRLILVAPKAAEKLVGVFGGGPGGGMDMAKIATNVASGLIGVTIAAAALAAAAGPLGALITGLAAAVISLAGSLVFAAGAVGGVALALTGPFVAGIGVAILALSNLDDKTKDALGKIGDRFSKLADSAGEAIGPGLRRAAAIGGPAIAELEPLIDKVAEAIGRVAVGWSQAVTGPDFDHFREVLEDFLPGAIERLGEATSNATAGVAGIFEAAVPMAEDFLDWLVKITDQFAGWANSEEGQEELISFFGRASESAKAVGDFLAEATEALAELLSAGKDEGDTIFKDMADQLGRFVNYMTDPKNKEAIDSFFSNGVRLSRELGNLMLDIGEAIDELDSPEARRFLSFLIEAIGTGLVLFGRLVQSIASTEHALISMASAAGRAIRNFFSGASQEARELSDKILGFFKGLGGRIVNVIGTVDWTKIVKDPTGIIIGWFQGLGSRILGVIGNIDIGSLVTGGGGLLGKLTATGGVFDGPQARIIGEAGPEAVVPLNRPLNQVDPSVRGLSAVAQGLAGGSGGMNVEKGAIVVYEAVDGRATASALLNRMTALSY